MPNGTSPTKRRRTKAELQALLGGILAILSGEASRITIRHLYYRLVSARFIEKTDAEYKILCSHLAKWRRAKDIPWNAFVDNLRWHMGTPTFDSMAAAIVQAVHGYRRNIWAGTDVYVELWCEKDAIAGVLNEVADSFGVKVFPCRGFASLSSLHSAAEIFDKQSPKRCLVYFFGDHDPSGLCIDRKAEQTLTEDFHAEVVFERVAVTPEQIEEFNLPTRPTKRSDSRAKGFEGDSVEIDAMLMAELRRLAEQCITCHLPKGEWERLKMIEDVERKSLTAALMGLPKDADPDVLLELFANIDDDLEL